MQAFAGAVKAAYPNHLRLSIHQSTGEHKISLSLLNTRTGFTTPWHCSVALMATGEWLSAPKGDLEQDKTLTIVEEEGRPSFFRQDTAPVEPEIKEAQAPVSGIFTENITADETNSQRLSVCGDALVGARASKGSSTAETTQSDSSQDTSPRKGEAPTPQVCQPQNKGTKLFNPITCHVQITDRLKLGFSVGSSERFLACNTYAFYLFSAQDRSRIPDQHDACISERQERDTKVILHCSRTT
jgi:hypothetical protein